MKITKKSNKKRGLHKKKGNTFDLVIILIGVLSIFIIVSMGMESAIEIDQYWKANLVCRKYLLKMESHGYLTNDDSSKLETQLENIGFTDISLSGSTMSQVNNGDDVNLNVNLTQHVKRFTMHGLNVSIEKTTLNETIPISSTAKN